MRHTISFTHEEAEAVYDALVTYLDADNVGASNHGTHLVYKAVTKFEAVTQQEGMEDEREDADDQSGDDDDGQG